MTSLIFTKCPPVFPLTRRYVGFNRRNQLPIAGRVGLEKQSVGPGERLEGVAEDYGRWLSRQPLSANTRRTCRTRVRGFFRFLPATPAEYGDPLSDGHARDYAARDYKTYLKTVGRAKPSSVNLTLAAIDSFYRFMGMGKPDAKREDLPGVAPGALRRRSRRSFCGRSRGAVPHAIGRGHRLRF